MALAIFADVIHVEPLRQIEVDLDRRSCPFAPERIDPFDVDLRAVERTAAFVDLPREPALFERLPELIDGSVPDFFGADRLLGPSREIGREFVSEHFGEVLGEIDDGTELFDDLLW